MKLDMPLENVEYQLFRYPETMQEGFLLFEKNTLKGVMFLDPYAHEGLGEAEIEALFLFLGVKQKSKQQYNATLDDMRTFVELTIEN